MQPAMIFQLDDERASGSLEQHRCTSFAKCRIQAFAFHAPAFALDDPVKRMTARGAVRRMNILELNRAACTEMTKGGRRAVIDQRAAMHAARRENDVADTIEQMRDFGHYRAGSVAEAVRFRRNGKPFRYA